MVSFHFICGCNSKYFERWLCLFESIKINFNHQNQKKVFIHFFDLGLTEEEKIFIYEKKKNLSEIVTLHYSLFDFSKYPEWVNINNEVGQWAWKAQCILQVMESIPIEQHFTSYLFWMDSCNIISGDLSCLENFLNSNGIYSNITPGYIFVWCHQKCIEYFIKEKQIDQRKVNYVVNCIMKNGALSCYYLGIDWVRDFIREYAHYSLVKEAIAPEGSSRENHRQDQSVLSILYYLYSDKYKFNTNESNIFFGINTQIGRELVK